MKERIFSTVILWVILIATLVTLKTFGCFIILLTASSLTQYEFYKLLKIAGYQANTYLGISFGIILLIINALTSLSTGESIALTIITLCLITLLMRSLNFAKFSLITTLIGIIYIPFMLSFTVKFVISATNQIQALATILLIIAIAKFSDVGGLVIGCKFGKNKLAPEVSPNKTFEGLYGSIITSTITGVLCFLLFRHAFIPQLTIINVTILAIILSVIALLGDMLESIVKRLAQVKDSGTLIPGIGGIFDLTDSLIFSLPFGIIAINHFTM